MPAITSISKKQLSDRLEFSHNLESDDNSTETLAWGVARLIRREIRRRGLLTRRELRQAIGPFLIASGFELELETIIRGVAEQMVDVGEITDLRVENQRGYAALPSRWIALSDDSAVLLGTSEINADYIPAKTPNEFLRRFQPTSRIESELEKLGIQRNTITDWLGEPAWKNILNTSEPFGTIELFLNMHIAELEHNGARFSMEDTNLLAVSPQPGLFFGMPWSPQSTRWQSPAKLDDGIYLGALPDDRNSKLWHPMLLEIRTGEGRSIPLNCNNDLQATRDLSQWLLIALSSSRYQPEQILVDSAVSTVTPTFPAPHQLRRCLNLIGVLSKGWTYSVPDWKLASQVLANSFPSIKIKYA